MRFRLVALAAVCGTLAFAGYHVSVLRGGHIEPVSEAIAAAGSEPGFFSSSEGSEGSDDYRRS